MKNSRGFLNKALLSLLVIILILIALAVAGLGYLGHQSRNMTVDYSLSGNLLRPCPDSPNCVNTEEANRRGANLPVSYQNPQGDIRQILENALTEHGGIVVYNTPDHIAATFQSQIFGFVDDFEIRIDEQAKQLNFRSASRVGHNDMNANSERLSAFIQRLKTNGIISSP